jgi:hypothetical protein
MHWQTVQADVLHDDVFQGFEMQSNNSSDMHLAEREKRISLVREK